MAFNLSSKLKIASSFRQKRRFFLKKTSASGIKPDFSGSASPSNPVQQRLRRVFRHVKPVLPVQIIFHIPVRGNILQDGIFRRISQRDHVNDPFGIGKINDRSDLTWGKRSEPAAADAAFPGGELDALDRRSGIGIEMRRRLFRCIARRPPLLDTLPPLLQKNGLVSQLRNLPSSKITPSVPC